VDTDDSWLALAFLTNLPLSAFLFDAEAVLILVPKAGSKPATHIVYSGEHSH